MNGLIDLDAILLLVRDRESKKYITEAVSAYRAGALRAAIVSTWIAVVFDFVHKLQDLARSGDAEGQALLKAFQQMQSANDIKASLKFEEELLSRAHEKFEFITKGALVDLERLRADRHRCAHPAMNSDDEAFSPSAELARTHIRNAVLELLQFPAVQGKAALARLHSDVESDYFPSETADAVRYLSQGPLAHPRDSLLRNFIVSTVKKLTDSATTGPQIRRLGAALNAVRQMHPARADAVFSDAVDDTSRRRASNGEHRTVIRLLRHVMDSEQWIKADVALALSSYVASIATDQVLVLHSTLELETTRAASLKRIGSATSEEMAALVKVKPRADLTERAIELYVGSLSFASANNRAAFVRPLVPHMTSAQVETVIDKGAQSSDVRRSFEFRPVLSDIEGSGILSVARFKEVIAAASLSDWYWPEPDKEDPF